LSDHAKLLFCRAIEDNHRRSQLFPNCGAAYLMSHQIATAVAVIIVEIKNESPINLNHSQ
jgi:hypothetical protein